ncbi:MAG TPA: hypothetical protein VIA82_06295 [Candidatus Limnocylindria bacterium]
MTGVHVKDHRAGLNSMRDAGQGWGQMAKDLGLDPGIGSIMARAVSTGRDDAPGQTEDNAGQDATTRQRQASPPAADPRIPAILVGPYA